MGLIKNWFGIKQLEQLQRDHKIMDEHLDKVLKQGDRIEGRMNLFYDLAKLRGIIGEDVK
jgi:hypothetical protein